MDANALQELSAFLNELWARLEGLHRRDAPLFASTVIGLVFLEGLTLGALLDLLLPRYRPVRGRRYRRRRGD